MFSFRSMYCVLKFRLMKFKKGNYLFNLIANFFSLNCYQELGLYARLGLPEAFILIFRCHEDV